MFRITNLMPVYEQDGSILEYRVSVDNGSTDGNSVSANLVIGADDIDITAIVEVCKQKLRETVGQRGKYKLEKYFNTASMLFGLVGGVITGILGGWDVLTHAIVVLVIVDYLTGISKAFVNKEVSSAVGFKGIFKKILIFVVIAVSVEMQKIIGDGVPLREIVIMFYIANEGISFIENVSEFLPLPQKMKDIFVQIRDKGEQNYDIKTNS